MNWWKVSFLVVVPTLLLLSSFYVLDTATLHNDMQIGYGDTKQDLAAMAKLVEAEYAGMSKSEFIAHLQSAYGPGEYIEDEGGYVLAGQLTFEFSENGEFRRALFQQ